MPGQSRKWVFEQYDKAEAETCAKRFCTDFRLPQQKVVAGTAEWTEAIKDWFAGRADGNAGVVVDASAAPGLRDVSTVDDEWLRRAAGSQRETHGEFLFDLTHWKCPPYKAAGKSTDKDYGSHDWWNRALGGEPDATSSGTMELLLALESEMGKCYSAPGTIAAVMQDASKLMAAAARMKVVVFASTGAANRQEIAALAKRMVCADRSRVSPPSGEVLTPVWIWLDLPWRGDDHNAPAAWLGTAGKADLKQVV